MPHNYDDVSLENLVLDQLTIPLLIFLFFLITSLPDIVLIMKMKIPSWFLTGNRGLKIFP